MLNLHFYAFFRICSGTGESWVTFDKNFILLERLCRTLKQQMKIWKRQKRAKKLPFPIFNMCSAKGYNNRSQIFSWNERMSVAKDLASAMTYLHKNRYEYNGG